MRDMVSTLPDLVVPQQYREVVERIAATAADLARTIAGGVGLDARGSGENADGDRQTALDLIADEAFRAALAGAGVRFYASEEQDRVVELDPDGAFALAIDPLDGSSNIAVNVLDRHHLRDPPRPRRRRRRASSGRGASSRGAGYVIYGPRCCLVTSFGEGVQVHQLDPGSGRFRLAQAGVTLPPKSAEFAINASNYRHWDPADPRLCRRLRRRHRGAARAGLQHALDRLAGRRGAPDPDPRRHVPLSARRAEGLRARAAAAASTSARRSPS